jgi:membrane protein DedA with SNARE-associated domain
MSIANALADYGYAALFVGSLLEGETVPLLAGFVAHQERLWMPAVVLTAFVGGALGDQLFFWIGRRGGAALLRRWPAVQRRAERLAPLLKRHDAWLIADIRFACGFRIAGPIAMGACGVEPRRFALFNILGAAVWAFAVSAIGYLFGAALEAWLGDLDRIEGTIMFSIVAAALGLAALLRAWRRRSRHGARPPG